MAVISFSFLFPSDNICQGLINSMLNSGNDLQVALAKEGLSKCRKERAPW